ncbi:MAG: hypothetical protein KTR31_39850 [Myxococcales bacterium]|nr:hypothetical protein [Myxococcales bacterium]
MHAVPILFLMAACGQDENAPPPQILGLWQVHQVETGTGELDGMEVALRRFPGCTWARQTWNFTEDSIQVGHDVLCPIAGSTTDEHVGCEVSAEVAASWDEAAGIWSVQSPVRARSRAKGLEGDAFGMPTTCTVEVAAGQYPVVRIRREDWRWEMRAPDGTVLRLKIPDSDDPDFVMAMRGKEASP